jgi:hypothetical protein
MHAFRVRLAALAVAAATVLLTAVAPVAAAPPNQLHVRERTATAFASACGDIPGGFLCVDVANGEVFLEGFAESGGDCTHYYGGGFTDAFALDDTLTGASVDATVYVAADTDVGCDGSFDTFAEDPEGTLSANWTGIGDVHNFRARDSFTDEECKVRSTARGSSRDAIADISLTSDVLSAEITGTDGFLAVSRDTFSLRCRA